MHSRVQPNEWVCLRLPSQNLKVIQLIPDQTVNLQKYGTFPANFLIGRPYHLTYEILDKDRARSYSELRIVSAAELHADTVAEEEDLIANDTETGPRDGGVQYELVGENGQVVMRSNQQTIDSAARQTLSMAEIETMKKEGTDAGKALIAKLMLSHTALDEKTSFSLAKYKLLKTKKYLRQFTLLPLDVHNLTNWLVEDKDPLRILEMREECLALLGCWGNVHYAGPPTPAVDAHEGGRWLVVDEVGGLLVAAMAERMGLLYPQKLDDTALPGSVDDTTDPTSPPATQTSQPQHLSENHDVAYAKSNTITLIHANAQPNLSLLKYYAFHPDNPSSAHPLTAHLKMISWLQLLHPTEDTTYCLVPPNATAEELLTWKSGKRGTYYRKRRRHFRTRGIADETRAGGFDGLLVASSMDPITILRACVPLLRGGAQVVIYSPTIEPLAEVADLYSTSRRTAFISSPPVDAIDGDLANWAGNEDFPLNPTLLLGVAVQTSKARRWQVLPGRTHPMMTGKGGAEGFVLTGTRVIPAGGKVAASGNFKKRKIDGKAEMGAQLVVEQKLAQIEEDVDK